MEFDKEYFQAREDGIKWLNRNPRQRDYAVGLDILKRMRFKPLLFSRLSMRQPNGLMMQTLAMAIRDGANVYRNPTNPRYADIVPAEIDVEVAGTTAAATVEEKPVEDDKATGRVYPENVRLIMRWFAKAYKERDAIHRMMRQLGESNSQSVMDKRKEYSDRINTLSDYMDRLYELRQEYFTAGKVPTDEDLERVTIPGTAMAEVNAPEIRTESASMRKKDEDFDAMDTATLKARRHNIRTQLQRKRNMLLYQKPQSKGNKENPMPDSPQRTKIEVQVAALENKLYQADKALAKRG